MSKVIMGFILSSLVGSIAAWAATDSVYCKENGKIYHARSQEGHFVCAGALMLGQACYTGKQSAIIEMINDGAFNWDEEWLEGASHSGRQAISYYWVDGPNELREKIEMKRCSNDFFRR